MIVIDAINDNTDYYNSLGFHFFNGHTFKYYSTALTWPNANTACGILAAHLATSTSAEKNNFLASLTSDRVWLGASDKSTEGIWQWCNGETWSYANWASGQPDNSGDEDYLEMNRYGLGKWNDLSASSSLGFICEWDFDFRFFTDLEALTWIDGYDFKFFGGHTFKYVNSALTWPNARLVCEAIGGHLPTSTSAEKNAFLRAFPGANLWLGGTDELSEGNWQWVNSEDWSYTNWNGGEPNNNSIGEPYLELLATGKWNDITPSTTHNYICEWDFDIRSFFTRNHEGLNNLLGGAVGEHYHFTKDEWEKLHKMIDAAFPDGEPNPEPEPQPQPEPEPEPEPEPQPQPETEPSYGVVFAIGTDAERWSNGAAPDMYGFRKLAVPKLSKLTALYNAFCGKAENGDWYTCTTSVANVGLSDEATYANRPFVYPASNIAEIAASRSLTIGSTGYATRFAYRTNTNELHTSKIEASSNSGVVKLSMERSTNVGWLRNDNTITNSYTPAAPVSIPFSYEDVKKFCATTSSVARYVVLTNDGKLYYSKSAPVEFAPVDFTEGAITDFWRDGATVSSWYVQTSSGIYKLDNSFKKVGKVFDGKAIKIGTYSTTEFLLAEDGTLYYRSTTGSRFMTAGINIATSTFTPVYTDYKFLDFAFCTNNTLVVTRDESQIGTPYWETKLLPTYLTNISYTAFNGVHKMYYGLTPRKINGAVPATALVVPLMRTDDAKNKYYLYTQDLIKWTSSRSASIAKYGAKTGDYIYFQHNTDNYKLCVLDYPDGTDTNIHYLVHSSTAGSNTGYLTNSGYSGATAWLAACHGDGLYIFASQDGHICRMSDAYGSSVLKENITCGIQVNPGCAAWSPEHKVYCVAGKDGTATSETGEIWQVHTDAPHDLRDLDYREDIDGFLAWSNEDKHFYASADGHAWVRYSMSPIPLSNVAAVDYNPDLKWYCAIGGNDKFAYFSKDLNTWVSSQVTDDNIPMGSVIWMANLHKYVLMPTSGTKYYTFDPAGWDNKELNTNPPANPVFASVEKLDWAVNSFPMYSKSVSYSAYVGVNKMYYGLTNVENNATPPTGLNVLMEYGNATQCKIVFTNDLVTWTGKAVLNKTSHLGYGTTGISQWMFVDTGSKTHRYRLYTMLPGDTLTNGSLGHYAKYMALASSTSGTRSTSLKATSNWVACCYSPELNMAIFVTQDGNVIRYQDFSTTVKEHFYCGMNITPGSAAWLPTAGVFCVAGSAGTAVSADGAEWTRYPAAPKNLTDLCYREDIPITGSKGLTAWSKDDKHFYASSNGKDWVRISTSPIPLSDVAAVDYNPDLGWYCAVGGITKYAYFSKDLKTWTPSQVANTDIAMGSVIWMPNIHRYVLMPTSGTIYYTLNPADWSD